MNAQILGIDYNLTVFNTLQFHNHGFFKEGNLTFCKTLL